VILRSTVKDVTDDAAAVAIAVAKGLPLKASSRGKLLNDPHPFELRLR
jgi:hypothetical protein